MTTTDVWDALAASESDLAPIFKFADPGDSVTGILVEEPVTLPLTAFGTREPKIGADGKPVMQILAVLATEIAADEDHDGRWRVFIDKPLMKAAVAKALREAGVRTLEVGGKLTLTFIGYRETRGGGSAKDFTANYEPAEQSGPIGTGELGEFVEDSPWGDPQQGGA